MPKQQLLINRFEGGLNTASDPRDIGDNEFSALNSLSVSFIGLIKSAGSMANETTNTSLSQTLNFGEFGLWTAPGHGLYAFSSDFNLQHTSSEAKYCEYTPTDFLVYMDSIDGWIYTNDSGWQYGANNNESYGGHQLSLIDDQYFPRDSGEAAVDYLNLAGEFKYDFYSANGGLRVCNSNFEIYHTPPIVWDAQPSKSIAYKDAEGNINTDAHTYIASTWNNHCSQCEFAPFKIQRTDVSGETPVASTNEISPASNLVMHNSSVDGDGQDLSGGSVDMDGRNLAFFDASGDSAKKMFSQSDWGLGLTYSERLAGSEDTYTGQNGSGTWQPTTLVKYKFWATVLYEGNQESHPVAFQMFGTQEDSSNDGLIESDEIQFLSVFGDEHDDGTVGNNMSVHFKPILRLVGDVDDAYDTTENIYAFGACTGPLVQRTEEVNLSVQTDIHVGNKRIIGSRIYWSESVDGHDNLWIMFDMNWEKGCKPFGAGEFTTSQSTWHKWDAVGTSHNTKYHLEPDDFLDNRFYDPPRFETYRSINGYSHKSKLNAKWKTSVVANGRVYIANIKRQQSTFFERYSKTDGDTAPFNGWSGGMSNDDIANRSREKDPEYPDRICKSPVGKYDIFPEENDIELFGANDDGDEIIKLEAFADRLLVFKKNILYILNISRDTEILEGSYKHFGLDGGEQCQSVVTDVGVAWMNSNGVYYYDGQNIQSLTDNKINNLWTGVGYSGTYFWKSSAGDIPSIGYDAKSKKIICAKNISDDLESLISSADDLLIYDLKSKSWSLNSEAMTSYRKKTNFVTFKNEMIYLEKTTMNPYTTDTYDSVEGFSDKSFNSNYSKVFQWSETPAASAVISLITKDYDFGAPSVRKKIYKVYVSYKGDGTLVSINYGFNGDNDTYDGVFYRTTTGGTIEGSSDGTTSDATPLLSVGTDDWVRAELKPTATINNIYSFQLKFDGTSTNNFEINDITIIYRMKSVK